MSAREDELYFYFGGLHRQGNDPCTLYNRPGFCQFVVELKRDMYYQVPSKEQLDEELERKGFNIQKVAYETLQVWPKFNELDPIVQAIQTRMKDVDYFGSFVTGMTINAYVNWHIHIRHRSHIHTYVFSLDGKTKPMVSIHDTTYACNPDEVLEFKVNWDDPHCVFPRTDDVLMCIAYEEVPGTVTGVPVQVHKKSDILNGTAAAVLKRTYKNTNRVPATLPDGRLVQPGHTVEVDDEFEISQVVLMDVDTPNDPWEDVYGDLNTVVFTVEPQDRPIAVRYRTVPRRYLYGATKDHNGNRYPEYEEIIIQPGDAPVEFKNVTNYKEIIPL